MPIIEDLVLFILLDMYYRHTLVSPSMTWPGFASTNAFYGPGMYVITIHYTAIIATEINVLCWICKLTGGCTG